MMGVDMALLAVKHRVDRIALLTGDSDTIPAVEVEIDDAMGPRTEACFLSGSFLEPRFVQPPVSVVSLQRLVVFRTVDR